MQAVLARRDAEEGLGLPAERHEVAPECRELWESEGVVSERRRIVLSAS